MRHTAFRKLDYASLRKLALDLACYVVPRRRVMFKDSRRGSVSPGANAGIVWWDELLKQFV
jgi:hypothetical protein